MQRVVVILGDNIIEDDISTHVMRFQKQKEGARLLLRKVHDPQRFGVAELNGKKVVNIVEKPKKPKSNYAVSGIYMFDHRVFEIIRTLKPSGRGELEITDVNNAYIKEGLLEYDILKGYWTDAGTFESLFHASELVVKKKNKKG